MFKNLFKALVFGIGAFGFAVLAYICGRNDEKNSYITTAQSKEIPEPEEGDIAPDTT